MSSQKAAAWAYAEEFVTAGEHVERARQRSEALGIVPLGNGAGAVLQAMAAATSARTVMEIGTGAGVSGLWLLGGMAGDGVLTSIDPETEHQRAAREAFAAAGVAHQRTRVIAGRALEVLPRMTDGAYDMVVVVEGDKQEYAAYLEQATRLLRRGGTLVMLWSDKVADPAARDAETQTLRDVGRAVRDHEHFVVALLPASTGLLVAAKR